MGEPAGVGPVAVVVVEVDLEVLGQAGHLGDEVAGEGRLPAFVEDGELDAFHAAVGLGAAGADGPVIGTEAVQGGRELSGAELAGVVGR